MDTTSKKKKQM